jgi:DNA-binding transcriptional ArsR family regulator
MSELPRNRAANNASPLALSEPVLTLVVRRMQMLADPLRVRLLLALQAGEASVQELADRLGTEHRNASRNLVALHREGMLARRREGTSVFYCVADYTTYRLIDQSAQSVAAHVEELSDLVSAID